MTRQAHVVISGAPHRVIINDMIGIVLALTQAQIDTEVREERLFEVNDDAQDL